MPTSTPQFPPSPTWNLWNFIAMFLRSMADMKNAGLTGTRPALLRCCRWGDRGTLAREASSGSLSY